MSALSPMHQARSRRAKRVLGGAPPRARAAQAGHGAEAGLQVPGLFKAKRDEELLKRAELLVDNWRILLRETYNLGAKGTPEEKLRPGFSPELGREVINGMKANLQWWQNNKDAEAGALLPQFTTELEQEVAAYAAVRAQVNHVLELQGARSAALDPARVYTHDPETPIVEGFQRRLLEALLLAALVALGLKIFGVGLRRAPPSGHTPRTPTYA